MISSPFVGGLPSLWLSLPSRSMGVVVGQQLLALVLLDKYKVYFKWDEKISHLEYATSIYKK